MLPLPPEASPIAVPPPASIVRFVLLSTLPPLMEPTPHSPLPPPTPSTLIVFPWFPPELMVPMTTMPPSALAFARPPFPAAAVSPPKNLLFNAATRVADESQVMLVIAATAIPVAARCSARLRSSVLTFPSRFVSAFASAAALLLPPDPSAMAVESDSVAVSQSCWRWNRRQPYWYWLPARVGSRHLQRDLHVNS